MSWNYRVLKFVGEEEPYYSIHEVYYNEDGEPYAYSKDQLGARAEGPILNLLFSLLRYLEAFNKPILVVSKIERELFSSTEPPPATESRDFEEALKGIALVYDSLGDAELE